MRWPWPGRTVSGSVASAAARAVRGTPSPAGWAFLPPLQRTIGDLHSTTSPTTFQHTLPAWRNPSFTGRMTHLVSGAAPSGVIDGDGRGVGVPGLRSPGGELPLVAPETSVQRTISPGSGGWAQVPARSAAPLLAAEPSALPVLHVGAHPADPEPAALPEPTSIATGFDNGGATYVSLPLGPPPASAAGSRAPTGGSSAPGRAPSASVQRTDVGSSAIDGPVARVPVDGWPASSPSSTPMPHSHSHSHSHSQSQSQSQSLGATSARPPSGPPRPSHRLGLGVPLPPAAPPSAAPPLAASPSAAPAPRVQRAAASPATPSTAPAEPATSAPVAPSPDDPSSPTPSGAERTVDAAAQSVPVEEPHRLAVTPLPAPVQRVAVDAQPAPTDSPDESVEPAQLSDAPLIHMPVAPNPARTTPTGGAPADPPAVPFGRDPARGATAALSDPTESVPLARPAEPAEPSSPPMTLRSAAPPTAQRIVGLLSQRMLTPLLMPATTNALTRSTQRVAAPQDGAASARPAAPVTMLPPVLDLPPASRADHFQPATVIPSTAAMSAPHHPLQRSVAGPPSAHRPAPPAAPAPVQRAVEVPEMEATPDVETEPTTPVPEPAAGPPASPQTAAAASSASTGAAGPGANPSPQELDKLAGRLVEPLTRRIKAEMLIDRERRGLRSDPR